MADTDAVLNGFVPRPALAAELHKSERQIKRWETLGLPVLRVGRTPYYSVEAARQWLLGGMRPAARRPRSRQ